MKPAVLWHLVSYALGNPIARRSPVRTAMRIANWQIKARIADGPIEFKWIQGCKLLITRGMTGATGNVYYGLQEFNEMSFLLHFLREDDLFLDVGANVGTFSVLAAKICLANCWAFEPSVVTLAELRANVLVNQIENRVTVHPVALSDHDGVGQLSRDFGPMNMIVRDAASGEGAVFLIPETEIAASKTDTVTTRRLDSLISDANPVLMKIDVEGHEQAMLSGAARTLGLPSLLAVQVETVTPEMHVQLTKYGFFERYYNPFTRALTERLANGSVHNRIYVRNEEVVKERLKNASRIDVMGVSI